ncbi:zinc finger protein [Rhizoctonia solani AG-3 Rhs1AP]|uniref:Zinc finger protein n=2 Tax=Rhizoctonia solani AG-3 TaxID=1086053 RepID=A0A074RTU0_9AGAM|nr:zinc finger protein [Rhizoctonia solani AG-3 Rhs1AP]KEP50269.1 zinc finger protein [Rhizoctonia solani 123E]
MSAHHVDHQPGHQYPIQQTHFTTPHQHQPQHQQQSTSASPQPQYYHAPQDHTNGYTNTQTYVNPQQAYAVPPTGIQQRPQGTPTRPSMVPPQSITQETYQSPVIAQPGSDWAKDLIKQARSSELKKHSLTLQLHTAQILSAHSSLEQRNKKLEDVRAQKDWLESERGRLLDELRKVNEEREKASCQCPGFESALQREVSEFKNKIKCITEGEYGDAKQEVEKIRKELGMLPLPSLQVTLEEKGASIHKRRLEQSNQETTNADPESPAVVPSSMIEPGVPTSGSGTAPVKRGPGRPRKVPIDASGDTLPGSSVVESGEDGASSAKRPRGRPKGSKNKPKVTSDPTNA